MQQVDAATSPFKNSNSEKTTVRNHSQLAMQNQASTLNQIVMQRAQDLRFEHETEDSDTIIVGIQSLGQTM